MNESRDPLAQLIDADRTLPEPETPVLDRVWSGIEHGLSSGAPGPVLDGQPLIAPSAGWSWTVFSVVVIAIAGAGLAVVGTRAAPTHAAPGLAPLVEQVSPASQEPAPQPDPNPEPEPSATPPDPTLGPAEPGPARRPRPPRAAPASPSPKLSLADEIALMRRLGQALARGDHKTAAGLLRRHEREFPKGALLEERRAASVRIACIRGDDNAQAKRAAFETRWPKSMHAAAIRKACGS